MGLPEFRLDNRMCRQCPCQNQQVDQSEAAEGDDTQQVSNSQRSHGFPRPQTSRSEVKSVVSRMKRARAAQNGGEDHVEGVEQAVGRHEAEQDEPVRDTVADTGEVPAA